MKSQVTRVTAATLLSANPGIDVLSDLMNTPAADSIQKFQSTSGEYHAASTQAENKVEKNEA